MSQYRKLTNARLEVDQIIVAHNPKSRVLNVPNGLFCKVISKAEKSVKVQVLGTKTELRFSTEVEGAWAYDPSSADTNVVVNCSDFNAWPRFTPRMQAEGWQGKVFKFDSAELHLDRDERSQGFGLTLLRHKGDTIDPDTNQPYTNNFLMSSIFPAEAPEWRIPRAERMGIGAVELPLPPKPVSVEHQEVIDKLTPTLNALRENHRSNVSFSRHNAELTETSKSTGQACHADLQRECTVRKVAYVTTIGINDVKDNNGWVKGKASDEATDLWITYLTSYSPYADAFLTKDPEYIKKYGYVLTADVPNCILVGACFATRQIWEKPARAEGFLELYKAGIPLDVAFVFGCQTSEYANGKMKLSEAGNGHSHLNNSGLSDKCILNFIKHTPERAGKKKYSESFNASGSNDYGVDGMWSKDFKEKKSEMFGKLSAVKGGGQWGASLPVDECVDRVCDLIEDWMVKHGV